MKVIVFDTETNGLIGRDYDSAYSHNWYKNMPHPVQVSYVVYDVETNKLVKASNKYFQLPDGVEFNKESAEIHKITEDHLKMHGETSMVEFLSEFVEDYENCAYAVGHNINFDISILQAALIRNGIHYTINDGFKSQPKHYCTMKYSRYLLKIERVSKYGKKYYKSPKLIELHDYLFNNEELSNLHNSMVDVVYTLRCYYKMMYDRDVFTMCKTVPKLIM
jgi:DNA polymerase III epsilon subunit-like protein